MGRYTRGEKMNLTILVILLYVSVILSHIEIIILSLSIRDILKRLNEVEARK